ncbi:CLUMA_CG018461, isoform A [Clunio marinus]|uniref:CLUMA_CG018461, isoform A n=1 Tax=Clunio marinus TaxID=568069 RepID=A0A1J1IZ47_9DIPT|nr:CLUMA_CG018461, isoform A [Clunio marinus]
MFPFATGLQQAFVAYPHIVITCIIKIRYRATLFNAATTIIFPSGCHKCMHSHWLKESKL